MMHYFWIGVGLAMGKIFFDLAFGLPMTIAAAIIIYLVHRRSGNK